MRPVATFVWSQAAPVDGAQPPWHESLPQSLYISRRRKPLAKGVSRRSPLAIEFRKLALLRQVTAIASNTIVEIAAPSS